LIQKTGQVLDPGSDILVKNNSINAVVTMALFQAILGLEDNPVKEWNEEDIESNGWLSQ
jgi:hypothetical protein